MVGITHLYARSVVCFCAYISSMLLRSYNYWGLTDTERAICISYEHSTHTHTHKQRANVSGCPCDYILLACYRNLRREEAPRVDKLESNGFPFVSWNNRSNWTSLNHAFRSCVLSFFWLILCTQMATLQLDHIKLSSLLHVTYEGWVSKILESLAPISISVYAYLV